MSSHKNQVKNNDLKYVNAAFGYYDGVEFHPVQRFLLWGPEAELFFRLGTYGPVGVNPAHITVAELDSLQEAGVPICRVYGDYGGLLLQWPKGAILHFRDSN